MLSVFRSFRRAGDGFTTVELITVVVVMAILACFILSISGSGRHPALTRTAMEIKEIQLALESYKADHGTYPHQPLAVSGRIPPVTSRAGKSNVPSALLDPRTNGNSIPDKRSYANASLELYEALTGDLSLSGTGGGAGVTNYISDMRPVVFGRYSENAPISGTNPVTYLSDVFGNCYSYSTANATAVSTGTSPVLGYPSTTATYPGFNSTYDLWSTCGQIQDPYNGGKGSTNAPGASGDPMLGWIKNW